MEPPAWAFQSLLGRLQTEGYGWWWMLLESFNPSQVGFKLTFFQFKMVQDKLFQSLLGRLQTKPIQMVCTKENGFQSLLGRLQTAMPTKKNKPIPKFQSLLGRLQTTWGTGHQGQDRSFNPSQVGFKQKADTAISKTCWFQSLLGRLQTLPEG